MSYLYGDSTPSQLEVNYIELLRDVVDFCVQALLADQRIEEGRVRVRALDQSTSADVAQIQAAAGLVPKAFEGMPFGPPESAPARFVAAIIRAAADLARTTEAETRTQLDADTRASDAQAAVERESCVKALERLLVKHDPPEVKRDLQLTLTGGKYDCRLHLSTAYGLEATVSLDVLMGDLLERIVRVDRLVERLDVQAPEMGGWLHKEIKLRAQHLEKHHLVELTNGSSGTTIKLRAGQDGGGAGFDLVFSADGTPRHLIRVDESQKQDDPPFDVQEADAPKLVALRQKLLAAAEALLPNRKAIVDPKIDGELVRTHPKPSVLAERLIAAVAPVVQEIAARSQSTGELVLRRLLGEDRREEIFLSKRELKAKLEPLQAANRALFDPLWRMSVDPPVTKPAPPAPLSPGAPPPQPAAERQASSANRATWPGRGKRAVLSVRCWSWLRAVGGRAPWACRRGRSPRRPRWTPARAGDRPAAAR